MDTSVTWLLQQASVLKSINKTHTCLIRPEYGVFLTADNVSTISLVHTFNFDLRIHVKSCDFNLVHHVKSCDFNLVLLLGISSYL